MKTINLIIFILLLSMSSVLISVEVNDLKSAYIEKFTRFIEWPSEEDNSDFTIGYIKNSKFIDNLKEFFSENSIKNRKVVFKELTTISNTDDCDLIYLPEENNILANQIIEKIHSRQVLLISHSSFYNDKVHLNFYIENNRLKFESNPKAFRESGLKVSYHLLRLSRIASNN